MKRINSYNVLFGLGVLLFMAACNSNTNSEAEKKEEIKDTAVAAEASKTPAEGNEAYLYALPSPMQIATILKKAGLKYYPGLTNSTQKADLYKSGNLVTKTLGLGIYLSDLSYCILNKQNQESKNYFKTCSQLSESIGLAKAFQDNDVPKRMEKNMANGDSVSKILSEIQMESDNVLEENNQGYISVIAFTGAWIESMYIGTQVHAKEKNPNVTTNIIEQMGIAENIIKALEVNKSKDADVSVLISELASLNEIYNNFKSVKEAIAADPDVIDPAKLTITVEELSAFSKKIEEIRSRIVKG